MTIEGMASNQAKETAGPLICRARLSSTTQPMSAQGLAKLADLSAINKVARGITGKHRQDNGSFLRFLEDSDTELEAVRAGSARDPRRRDLIATYRKAPFHRTFEDGAMACLRDETLGPDPQARLHGLRQFAWQSMAQTAHHPVLDDLLDTFRSWIRG